MFERIVATIKEERENVRKGSYIVLVLGVLIAVAVAVSFVFNGRNNDVPGQEEQQTIPIGLTSDEKNAIEENFMNSADVGLPSGQKASLEKKFDPHSGNVISEEEKKGIENRFNSN